MLPSWFKEVKDSVLESMQGEVTLGVDEMWEAQSALLSSLPSEAGVTGELIRRNTSPKRMSKLISLLINEWDI